MSATPDKTVERPSEDVLRIVHAFGDSGRKAEVRALAKRVRANEDALDRAKALLARAHGILELDDSLKKLPGEIAQFLWGRP